MFSMLSHIFIVFQKDSLFLIKLFAFLRLFYMFYTFWYKAQMLFNSFVMPIVSMPLLTHAKMQ